MSSFESVALITGLVLILTLIVACLGLEEIKNERIAIALENGHQCVIIE